MREGNIVLFYILFSLILGAMFVVVLGEDDLIFDFIDAENPMTDQKRRYLINFEVSQTNVPKRLGFNGKLLSARNGPIQSQSGLINSDSYE